MKLDTVYYRGEINKPALVFIHGIGMNKDIWINPSNACILGERFPLKILLRKQIQGEGEESTKKNQQCNDLKTTFDDLRQKGYNVITWSQRRPSGPVDSVVKELNEIIKITKEMTDSGIILIGHSRGGLVGRKYLLKRDKAIKALVTISSPHKGSSIAHIAKYLSPLVSITEPFVPKGEKGTLSFSIKRILEFLKSRALKELLPDSAFFRNLKDEPLDWVYYISAGGTNPTLLHIYHIYIPDIFEKIIPEKFYPEEFKRGRGDGLVSAESSKIPWGNEHYNFDLNHAEILFDKGVRDVLAEAVEKIR
ncbi:MAG: alpha/beta fold hydrolase [Nitrospirae bacterium]|nr:alpha/beta fold hydrolase [Nitrospirota bacterium]